MKIIEKGNYSLIVWMRKGESFPGTDIPQKKQGYYRLWTGSNISDFEKAEYLGPRKEDIYYYSAY